MIMNKQIITIVFIICATSLMGQVAINTTNFPDAKFRTEVQKLDGNNDGSLSSAEIKKVSSLNVYNKSIANLKGIEHFTALTYLNVSQNRQLAILDRLLYLVFLT